jgi:hypothetical protein
MAVGQPQDPSAPTRSRDPTHGDPANEGIEEPSVADQAPRKTRFAHKTRTFWHQAQMNNLVQAHEKVPRLDLVQQFGTPKSSRSYSFRSFSSISGQFPDGRVSTSQPVLTMSESSILGARAHDVACVCWRGGCLEPGAWQVHCPLRPRFISPCFNDIMDIINYQHWYVINNHPLLLILLILSILVIRNTSLIFMT